MDNDQDLAIAQLRALAKIGGALKVVTHEIQPHLRADRRDPRSHVADRALDEDPLVLRNPRNMVCHDVAKLEGPDDEGMVTVRTAEGDWARGRPWDLLARLTEHQRAV